ncbi:uncharacterized protein LOC134684040 [Mytilus trossulus]|uniref:uncharacterized protein LOC134684040 n=1 Tax=Mytilus trossulus TaxID=6551 RepID=UPI0030042E40
MIVFCHKAGYFIFFYAVYVYHVYCVTVLYCRLITAECFIDLHTLTAFCHRTKRRMQFCVCFVVFLLLVSVRVNMAKQDILEDNVLYHAIVKRSPCRPFPGLLPTVPLRCKCGECDG